MKKITIAILAPVSVLVCLMYFVNIDFVPTAKALTKDVTLTTNVQSALTFTIPGDPLTVAFGDLSPASPIAAPAGGVVCSVTTNAANGYTMAVHDGSATNSALKHTDTTTYIPDLTTGTITVPTVWGSQLGVGITLFTADNTAKEVKWGTGTTYNDVLNKYAAIPATAGIVHTLTGYHATVDTSSWAFKIDVPATQKTGAYSGVVTFTASAVVS